MVDPLLEQTSGKTDRIRLAARRRADKAYRQRRRQSKFEVWAWTEIPAYRAGLLMSYIFSVYFGLSALIAGVPAFNIAAPEGWTPIWSIILIVAGPIGLIGIIYDTPKFRLTELIASTLLTLTLGTYAITLLVLAYGVGDNGRVAVGSGFLWLFCGPFIRTAWLIPKVLIDRQNRKKG